MSETKPVPRCGDTVLHRPSGNRWVVAYADHERNELSPAGWPEGTALLSDCDIVHRCSDDEHRVDVECWIKSAGAGMRRERVISLYRPDVDALGWRRREAEYRESMEYAREMAEAAEARARGQDGA